MVKIYANGGSVRAGGRGELTDPDRCFAWFLLVGIPALLLLCLLTPPFEVADEPSHLKRAVALTSGEIEPIVSLHDAAAGGDGKSAGGLIDTGLADMADRFVPQKRSGVRETPDTVRHVMQAHATGVLGYDGFSNTAIYPPMLYVGSMIGVAIGRVTGAPLLAWLYLARICNALLVGTLIAWSIRRGGDSAPFLLVVAFLPQTLFQIASASADSLLFGMSFVFAAGLVRLATRSPAVQRETIFLCIATVWVCAGKVAFIPLALLPPIIARWADGYWSKRAMAHAGTLLLSAMLWAAWAAIVRNDVFTIQPWVHVDPQAQLAWMIHFPIRAAAICLASMVDQAPRLLGGLPGMRLGWLDFVISKPFILLSWAMIGLSALVAATPTRRIRWTPAGTAAFAIACYPIIFVLLYLQFNAVGAATVKGVLSRYFIPSLLLGLCLTPRFAISRRMADWVARAIAGWSAASVAVLCVSIVHHYWR